MNIKIKQNDDDCQTELWFDGAFQAGWKQVDIPDDIMWIIKNMMSKAIDHGKRLKSEEIRKVIGV